MNDTNPYSSATDIPTVNSELQATSAKFLTLKFFNSLNFFKKILSSISIK